MRTRKSPRLQGYDYSLTGGYFVTINAKDALRLFGEIAEGVMTLSAIGTVVAQCWRDIPSHHRHVKADEFVVMPNHVHGILWLDESHTENTRSLGVVVATYKAAVTRTLRRSGVIDDCQIWQSRYHDHIIRTEESLNRIRAYIVENPARWLEDRFHTE